MLKRQTSNYQAMMLRLLTLSYLASSVINAQVCYDKENSPNGLIFPENVDGRDCPRLGCVDCGGNRGYCPEEGIKEPDGNGGQRTSYGCFELNDQNQFLSNRNCVDSAEDCDPLFCQPGDIPCFDGTIRGQFPDCSCECLSGFEGEDCSVALPPTNKPTRAPTKLPEGRVVCIENGKISGSASGVFPQVSDIDGRICPNLGCIDCGSGLPVNGQPPSDLGYCPAPGTIESDGEGGTRASVGCNARTPSGGFIRNINCMPTASECGDLTGQYYTVTKGLCGDGASITDKATCEVAASTLGLDDITVNKGQFKSRSKWPAGCWYNTQKKRLHFNKQMTSKPAKGKKQLLCFGDPTAVNLP